MASDQQNKMMRFWERRQNHVQTVLDSADIVRERIYRHLSEFASLSMNFERLSQFCVLGLCSDQDRNIRVGVLPKSEEILIRRSGFRASGVSVWTLRRLSFERVRAGHA